MGPDKAIMAIVAGTSRMAVCFTDEVKTVFRRYPVSLYNYPNVPLEKPNHSNILKNLFNAYQLKAFFGID